MDSVFIIFEATHFHLIMDYATTLKFVLVIIVLKLEHSSGVESRTLL